MELGLGYTADSDSVVWIRSAVLYLPQDARYCPCCWPRDHTLSGEA